MKSSRLLNYLCFFKYLLSLNDLFLSLLGNFIDLIGVFLGSNMLQVCRSETKRFMEEVKNCADSKRTHLFEGDLGFDKDGQLCVSLCLFKFDWISN